MTSPLTKINTVILLNSRAIMKQGNTHIASITCIFEQILGNNVVLFKKCLKLDNSNIWPIKKPLNSPEHSRIVAIYTLSTWDSLYCRPLWIWLWKTRRRSLFGYFSLNENSVSSSLDIKLLLIILRKKAQRLIFS